MSTIEDLIDLFVNLIADLILFSSIRPDAAHLLGLAAIVIIAGLTFFFSRHYRRAPIPLLRGIDGVLDLQRNIETAAENGKTVHFSLGTGSLGDIYTAQTLAGLDVLQEVGSRAAYAGPTFVATTASALALPVLDRSMRNAYAATSSGPAYQPENRRFIAPTPVAYAAGTMRVLKAENVGFNVMAGAFGDEYLLMGETGASSGARQLVAAADPMVLPFVVATADYPVIGEELFALSTYLQPLPARVAGIVAQDVVRLVIVVLIVALVVTYPWLGQYVAAWAASATYP